MSGTRRIFLRAALTGVLAVACWGYALLTASGLEREYGGVSVRLAEPSVTRQALDRAAEQKGGQDVVCAAAWTRGSTGQTASSALGGSTKLRVVAVYGDIRRAIPVAELTGSFPTGDDTNGCLIDAKSAWELFHAKDAVGAELTLGDKRYVVRGIVKTFEQTLVVRSEDANYENLEFTAPDPATAKQAAETALYRLGASGNPIILQNSQTARVALGLTWLPLWVGCALAAAAFLRRAWRERRNLRAGLSFACAGAALLAVCVAGLLKTAYWPQSFLPTKWSDFSFWGEWIDGCKEQWRAVSLATPLPKDILLRTALRRCTLCLLLSLPLAGWSASEFRRWNDRRAPDGTAGAKKAPVTEYRA